MRRLFLLAAVSLACATTPKPRWVDASAPMESKSFLLQLPEGWMRSNQEVTVLATRDGPLLQEIFVERLQVGKPLRNTKKTVAAGMMPQEAAEVIADDLVSNPGTKGLQIVENAPATVGGAAGFRILAAFKNGDGLKYRKVVYGVLAPPWFYRLTYTAPERHYFDADLPAFETVAASFRPGSEKPPPEPPPGKEPASATEPAPDATRN
jgi:hypothetical protein